MKLLTILGAVLPALNQFLPGVQSAAPTAQTKNQELEIVARKNIHAEFSSLNSSEKVTHDEEGKHLDFSELDVCSRIVPIELAASPLNKTDRDGKV